MEGTPFGRYRLVGVLGRGGMGEVWRAHDVATDRVVAIKTLPAQFSGDPMFQQRFRREAQAAARLNSPHVIPIYDYGEIEGRLFVCMRLIEGRDLQAVLTDGPMPPSRAVRIIEQVAKALHAAHKVGLVHRDVKPSNVLLDEDDFAYLIDFGIARATDDTRMTGTGNAIGTFQYMAPERLADSPDDARGDIYALACVLYECLTGHPPFAGTNMASLVAAHLNTPPPRPSTARADLPHQLDDVVATGMAKDPGQRYTTTAELAVAAHDAITTPGSSATQDHASAQPPTELAPASHPLAFPQAGAAPLDPDHGVTRPSTDPPPPTEGDANLPPTRVTPSPSPLPDATQIQGPRPADDQSSAEHDPVDPAAVPQVPPEVERHVPAQTRPRDAPHRPWWRRKPAIIAAVITAALVIVATITTVLVSKPNESLAEGQIRSVISGMQSAWNDDEYYIYRNFFCAAMQRKITYTQFEAKRQSAGQLHFNVTGISVGGNQASVYISPSYDPQFVLEDGKWRPCTTLDDTWSP